MHELSIALSVLDIVREAAAGAGLARVETVRLRVGKATGVLPDALLFAFDCSKAGTPAAAARLEIEEVSIGGHCGDCARDFTSPEPYVLACPLCGGGDFRITTGDELAVLDLEGEP
ncbi:MAG TPA: hydrogenase maturation nickel metallochaperone HypA [Candidatus Methanoperedens sp.]|nr:hydrogenase maturation nickel metallochaperone HypA [Candidatus Methanoperedens sp.]